jgi:hypothetical protein
MDSLDDTRSVFASQSVAAVSNMHSYGIAECLGFVFASFAHTEIECECLSLKTRVCSYLGTQSARECHTRMVSSVLLITF